MSRPGPVGQPWAPSKPNLAGTPVIRLGDWDWERQTEMGTFWDCAVLAAPPAEKSSLFDFQDDRIKATTLMGESAETEFVRYFDNHDTAVNPLEFFKSHKSSFPKMFKMIPQIMCAPGSTAVVDYILSPTRMSLKTDENFENQLFANLNRGIFEVSSNKLKLC